MTHLLDTSAALAHYWGEAGADRVDELLREAGVSIGISVLSVFEIAQAVAHRTGDDKEGGTVANVYAGLAHEIAPVSMETVREGLDLRRSATARIALADCLIAATAAQNGAVLVHRDPHFSTLPAERPRQEVLPPK
ncbi:type II toxin-antitoxin system VapC family toxin [Fimbriimonas ginsengisoli]|uniref:Ribonuclease VapC n=1 Tax=Fimbriimonas ginsengisoli Gsoil 348 TaxID=661478 RepID=A0A068NPJ4_FIMGI|nr:PIN domain-containing protein [Fimbriimonas ginsengisoli]AIE85297.1 PilT protein domain-containing protein [Fimbriimonas ginsengisoli Gsoil 348]